MKKQFLVSVLFFSLVVSMNLLAQENYPVNNQAEIDFQQQKLNEFTENLNEKIADQVKQLEFIVAENMHNHNVLTIQDVEDIPDDVDREEIQNDIADLTKEMGDMGKEFKDEMLGMSEELKSLVKMLRSMGNKESGKGSFLGILLDEDKGVDEGVLLLGVTPDGPAQKAGLQADDIITRINQHSMAKNKNITPAKQLYKAMKNINPGDKITLQIMRDGQQKEISFSAGKRSDHLQSGINFLADDLEKRITKNIRIDLEEDTFSGIELYPVEPKLGKYFGADKGMLVLKTPESNEFQLQQGDVILKIDNRTPKSSSQTWRIFESYDKGDKINLTLMRDLKEIVISIKKP